jgi:hypothetical protein
MMKLDHSEYNEYLFVMVPHFVHFVIIIELLVGIQKMVMIVHW